MSADEEPVELERDFYRLLRASNKALITRLGGQVELTADELQAAEAMTCRTEFLGGADEWWNGTWQLTVRDEVPPDEPEIVA